MADLSSDLGHLDPEASSASRILMENRDEIIRHWKERLFREVEASRNVPGPIIINTLPTFLDNLAEALSKKHPRALATNYTSIAQEHGGERARMSHYAPEHLIKEYQLLREAVLEKLSSLTTLTEKERSVIRQSFDFGIQEAMMAFFLVHSRIREQFTAGLSHDLRGPLASAKLAAELILKNTENVEPPDVRERIQRTAERILNSMKRSDRMIQDLLDASVLQFGEKLQLKPVECEIMGIAQDVASEYTLDDRKRILITGAPVRGFWDCDGLRRILENLITNAFKYGANDRPITIDTEELNGRMILRVHNEGAPIPIQDQEFLFQPFRRSDFAKRTGRRGWGIGLALVRGIAEAHGGSVAVDSTIDHGTTFMVDIPVDARKYAQVS